MYPENVLPDVANVVRYVQAVDGDGNPVFDADDNPVYAPQTVIASRKARWYKDSGKDTIRVKDGMTVKGAVTFKYHAGDSVLDADEITMTGPEFSDTGNVFEVVYASLKMTWSRPSHWEITLGVYA